MAIRPTDQGWCNTFTRLLLRKKNRNYLFYKKCELDYKQCLNSQNSPLELVTRLLHRKNKVHQKSRDAANDSNKDNRRAKASFYNTVNDTLRNPSLSAKKKFCILLKLMNNNKFSSIPPLVENDVTVQDPSEKSNIFNQFFAAQSTVESPNEPATTLPREEGVNDLNVLNKKSLILVRNFRIGKLGDKDPHPFNPLSGP